MPNLIVKVIGDAKQFERTMAGVSGTVKRFSSALTGIGVSIGIGALVQGVANIVRSGSGIANTAEKIGVASDFLQAFTFKAKEAGTALNVSEKALQKFVSGLGEARQGQGSLLSTLNDYGIALDDANGKSRTAESVLADYAAIIRSTEDPVDRLRLAVKAFGQEGASLANFLSGGRAAIEGLQKAGAAPIISRKNLDALDRWSDRFDTLAAKAKAFFGNLVGGSARIQEAIDDRHPLVKLFGGAEIEPPKVSATQIQAQLAEAERQLRAEGLVSKGLFGDQEFAGKGIIKPRLDVAVYARAKEIATAAAQAEAQLAAQAAAAAQAKADAADKSAATAGRELGIQAEIAAILAKSAEEQAQLLRQAAPPAERILELETLIGAARETANDAANKPDERLRSAQQLADFEKEVAAARIQQADEAASTRQQLQSELDAITDRIAALSAQEARKRGAALSPTFADVASGRNGSSSQQRDAARIIELEGRLRELQVNDGRAPGSASRADSVANVQRQLDSVQDRFQKSTGIDPKGAKNEQLEDLKEELVKVNNKLENL